MGMARRDDRHGRRCRLVLRCLCQPGLDPPALRKEGRGTAVGRGLAEAARAPAQVASAVFAMSTLPVNSAKTRLGRADDQPVKHDS